MQPKTPITDKQFKYTNAANTDLAARFKREYAKLKQQPQPANVVKLRSTK